jgi:hypothetical protein
MNSNFNKVTDLDSGKHVKLPFYHLNIKNNCLNMYEDMNEI